MTKITAYAALAATRADNMLPVVDVHDTSMASSGTTKKITVATLRGLDWLNAVTDFGAAGDGTSDNASVFAAIGAAMGTAPCAVYLPSGTYKTSGPLPSCVQGQSLIGPSSASTAVNYTGSGTCLTAGLNGTFTGGEYGGRYEGFYLGGYGAGGSAVGMQVGNIQGTVIRDVAIYGFGGGGLKFVNTGGGWSEQYQVTGLRLVQNGGTSGANMTFDGSSCDYAVFETVIVATAGQDGIRMVNGAQLRGNRLAIRGNFYGGTPNAGAVIAIDRGDTDGTSYIQAADLDIAVETAGTGTGHYTVLMGSANAVSQFTGQGVLAFINVAVPFQGVSNPNYLPFGFSGHLADTVLGTMAAGDGLAVIGGTQLGQSGSLAGGLYLGNVYFQFADVIAFRLASGANTLTFNGAAAGFAKRADLWISQPASGAAGTITWPAGIKWASAAPPALSSVNGYVDHVRLTYLPSESGWYGELAGTHYA